MNSYADRHWCKYILPKLDICVKYCADIALLWQILLWYCTFVTNIALILPFCDKSCRNIRHQTSEIQSQKYQSQKRLLSGKCKFQRPQTLSFINIHEIGRAIRRLEALDYGMPWLLLNGIPNNKHQMIKFHMLRKLCDIKIK